jgi:hypothetical protein
MCSHNHWFQLLYQWKNIHHKRSSSRSPQINNNGESFEENNKVEDDIKEKIFGGIFMEGDEKEKSCLSAIYVDFSKYISPEEPHLTYRKENSRTSFFSSGGV